VIVSDDPRASAKIDAFAAGDQRMAVCVRMISEGVDIPRAACLAWMTSYRTPLFFAQAVGRVVRARAPHESATVFLPAVRPLLALAADLEEERNHVIPPPSAADEQSLDVEDVARERGEVVAEPEALDADAQFAHVLSGGRAVVAPQLPELTADDEDFLGLPGLFTPEQMATLLAQRDAVARRRASAADDADGPARNTWRAAAELRREVNRLVSVVASRSGQPHAHVHAQLRQAVPGPPSASASAEVLEQRRDHLMALVAS
jgi:superfamily II DNA or RNA helicase